MESLLREYEAFCAAETERYDRRKQTNHDYVFRRKGTVSYTHLRAHET